MIDGYDDLSDILRAVRDYAASEAFHEYAESAAMQMVTHLFRDNGRTWRQAARANSQGRQIFEALQAELDGPLGRHVRILTQQNAKRITRIPLTLAEEINRKVLEESMKGTRSSDIANLIKKDFPHLSEVKVNLIARTETSKTSTALTRARSEYIGAGWYVWRTSEDSRVRKSHKHMDDVLVRWDDPPSPEALVNEKSVGRYNAGDVFNCRCFPEPLLDFDQVRWPAKVYYNGVIQRMSRKQFELISE